MNLFEEIEGNTMHITLRKPKDKEVKSLEDIDSEKLLKVLKKRAKEIKKHFKEDGWDLNMHSIREDIVYDVLGFHLGDIIQAYIAGKVGEELVYENNRFLLRKKGGHSPVYYDMWKDKFIVINNPDTKDYIMDYREVDGYLYLGGL